MNKYSSEKISFSWLIFIVFLLNTQPLLAQMDDIDLPPQVTCPETYQSNRCGPSTAFEVWSLDVFNPSDDNTPVEELVFKVQDFIETF